MQFSFESNQKANGAALLLALETSIGSRKGEFLDPNITFMTYAQWKKSVHYTNALRIGTSQP